MEKLNEFLINKNITNTKILDKDLLYACISIIYGFNDISEPWYCDHNYLKLTCDVRGFSNDYEYIKNNIDTLIEFLKKSNISYEQGDILKYKYAEKIFNQQICQ